MSYLKITILLLAITISLPSLAQSSKIDILKDAIDPLNTTKQRVAFLRIAGVDSEIDETEFEKDKKTKQIFARIFDRWPTALNYDKNKSKTLDWFEALAYRKALRRVILEKYDKNKDDKLTKLEREQAIKDLLANKAPRITKDKSTTKPATDNKTQPATPRKLSESNKRFDTNNDGKLDTMETQRMHRIRQEEWMKKRKEEMDTNKDGEISLDERKAHKRKEFEIGRQNIIKEFDTDKNGKLSQQEIINATNIIRENSLKDQNRRLTRLFDKDKDRKLSQEEQANLDQFKAEVEQLKRKRMAELLPTYDVNRNNKLDSFELFKLFIEVDRF